jgi:hypothetical protein
MVATWIEMKSMLSSFPLCLSFFSDDWHWICIEFPLHRTKCRHVPFGFPACSPMVWADDGYECQDGRVP